MSISFKKYTEKSILVEGDTKPWKENIKAVGGKWNKALQGWIFPSSKLSAIEKLVTSINSGKAEKIADSESNYVSGVSKNDFTALLARMEAMEIEIAKLKKSKVVISKPVSKPIKKSDSSSEEESESEESSSEDESPPETITKFKRTK
jgi:hypothetical protein